MADLANGSDPNRNPNDTDLRVPLVVDAYAAAIGGVLGGPLGAAAGVAGTLSIEFVASLLDARHSADNGIQAAIPLAKKLICAGAIPSKMTLVGHSNGAGFMASLAQGLWTGNEPHQKVSRLSSLDAPKLTIAWKTRAIARYWASCDSCGMAI